MFYVKISENTSTSSSLKMMDYLYDANDYVHGPLRIPKKRTNSLALNILYLGNSLYYNVPLFLFWAEGRLGSHYTMLS